MKRIAVIKNNIVENIVLDHADPAVFPNYEFVDVTDLPVGPGYKYISGAFYEPDPIQEPKQLTHLAFSLRFTRPERKAIKNLRKTDEDVDDTMSLFEMAKFIDLDHPATVRGMTLLQAKGIFTAQRVGEIMTTEVQPHERP